MESPNIKEYPDHTMQTVKPKVFVFHIAQQCLGFFVCMQAFVDELKKKGIIQFHQAAILVMISDNCQYAWELHQNMLCLTKAPEDERNFKYQFSSKFAALL